MPAGIFYFILIILQHKLYSMRKTIILPLALLFTCTGIKAQFPKPGAASQAFSESLTKITEDFRSNYYHIQGEQLPSGDDMDIFRSTVQVPGAKHAAILRFHSKIDSSASWQALMYEGDDYKEALKVYKSTCKHVDNSRLKLQDKAATGFSGKMDEPDANLRFVSSVYTLKIDDPAYEKFYAEVEMVNISFDLWAVRLNLQSKKPDADRY